MRRRLPIGASPQWQHFVGFGGCGENGTVETGEGSEEACAVAFEGQFERVGLCLVDGVEAEVLKRVAGLCISVCVVSTSWYG